MRNAFVNTLTAFARKDPRVMLVTGDLGFTVFEKFRDELPDQFLNAGVAEQNMIGVAAGLAMSGRRVFTYSIIPFTTFRCLEQIRNDVCYHRLPVCMVGVGAGYSYGHMGSTHHALEDIAVMRSLPGIAVVCPGDPVETGKAVEAMMTYGGPCYLRLGKAGEPALHKPDVTFTVGKAIRMRPGKDVTIIATGTMLETSLKAADLLAVSGIDTGVVSMHTIKPLDELAVLSIAKNTRLTVTVEEHSIIGGLGGAVAECLSINDCQARHMMIAAPDGFAEKCGSQAFLREAAGLTAESIAKKILSFKH